MKKGYRVGLDLGSKFLRLLVTAQNDTDKHPKIVTGGVEQSEGIRHGRIVDRTLLKAALRKLFEKTEKELDFEVDVVNLAISGDFVKSQIVKTKNTVAKATNEVTDLDFENARAEALASLPVNSPYHILNVTLSQIKLDGKQVRGGVINSVGSIIETTQVLHLIPKKILEEFLSLFEELGKTVNEVVLGQLVSFIPVTTSRERDAGVAVLNIGHDTTTFTYFERELPQILKSWSIGGANITNDIALIMQAKIEDAEEIKKNFKTLNLKKVSQIINARVEDIADLLRKEFLQINSLGKIPGGIVLIGGGSKIDEIENTLKKSLGMQVSNGNKIMQEITKNILKDSSWASAYGLTYNDTIQTNTLGNLWNNFKKFFMKILAKVSP